MKISFVSRGTLLISLFSLIGMITLKVLPTSSHFFILDGTSHFTSWKWYLSNFTYIFGHIDSLHLIGNLSIILLLGPLIELKFGTKRMLIMTFSTAVLTALLHTLLWDNGLLGASGIAFMYIVLSSLLNSRGKEIPFTFILIVLLYLGQEIYSSFNNDNISHFAHLFGGAMGAFWGFYRK
jgi:membrane associated rhomboid family serine protease